MDKLYSAGDVVFMMSYEAHFHFAGYVNKHNRRYWAQQKTPDSLTRGRFRVPKFQFSMGYQKSKLLVHTFVKRMAQQLLSIITLLC